MVNGCRGDDEVLGDRKDPLVEHGTDLVREPFVQLGAAVGFVDKLYAKSNLGKSDHADMKLLKRLVVTNATTLGSGFGRRSSDKMLVSSSHAIKT
jgi:hypothetical protein